MEVAIIKYNAGNIFSVVNALRRMDIEPVLTDDREIISRADRIIFPGQGSAETTMRYIREHHLDDLIRSLQQPVLGIWYLCGTTTPLPPLGRRQRRLYRDIRRRRQALSAFSPGR